MSRSPQSRLADIVDYVDAAKVAETELERAESEEDHQGFRIAYDAVLYDLVVIGEAVKDLPEHLKARRPEIPWSDIARLRDLLAHQYYKVRADVIRKTLDQPLEELRSACEQLLSGRDLD